MNNWNVPASLNLIISSFNFLHYYLLINNPCIMFFGFTHIYLIIITYLSNNNLTHSFPMHPFCTPWKHQKTFRFSDVFRGYRKGALGTNKLIIITTIKLSGVKADNYLFKVNNSNSLSVAFIVNCGHISQLFLLFLPLTLSR